MLLPIKWLKEYVDLDIDVREISDKLTDSGSHVESIESLEIDVENVVVGKILKIEEHPNADKLVITNIDVGGEEIVIVTGAKNVKEGDYVPVARVGAVLADGMEIEVTDFRGVDSYGMLCSLEELGYKHSIIPTEYRDGIYLLKDEKTLGKDMREVLELHGDVMEFEITPNRPDCQSIIGMARETAATFDKELILPEIKINEEFDNIDNYIDEVKIDKDLCNRYYGKVIKDIVIEDSPQWLQNRLMEAGVRPINNIVDVTNYVMLEFGQPLHAFDLDTIEAKTILVRRAEDGEVLKTLDDKERKLNKENLLIADKEKAIGIAGVMGGLNSEITKDTKTVFLESANFNNTSIRRTARELNLRSDASARFEKWIDTNLAETVALRACQLIEKIGAGKIVEGFIDEGSIKDKETEILLRPERVNSLLGTELNEDEIKAYLNRLGLGVENKEGKLKVTVATFRNDLKVEVDLIEEVGRLYSFQKIEMKPLTGKIVRGNRPYSQIIEKKIGKSLLGVGYNEVMTYSFLSPKSYDKLLISETSDLRDYITLINPLGEDFSVMRTTLISNIMELLSRDYNRGIEESMVFEIGNIFTPRENEVLPKESKKLVIGMYGEKDLDFYYIKEALNIVFRRLNIDNISYRAERNNLTFHPNRTASISLGDQDIGVVGEIHMDVSENYGIKPRVYMAEINLEPIIEAAKLEVEHEELPKYPSTSRDIALVVDEDILVGDIEKVIWDNNTGIIEEVELFDIYSGDQIEDKKKSIAFSIIYRSAEGTLKDEEVNGLQEKIIKDLEYKLDGKLRS